MEVNYEVTTEALIDFMLSDYSDYFSLKEDEERQRTRETRRLASLNYYDNLPVSKILEVAENRNKTFYFLGKNIDVEMLQTEIHEQIKKIKGE